MNFRFFHISAYASGDFYPSDIKVSGIFALHAKPELLSPYSSLYIIITIPFSVPISVPDSVQSSYLHLELRYALPISHAIISKSFKDASINSIRTLSLDTKFEYLINDGSAVVWPSATNISYLVNFPYILLSNIMCALTWSYTRLTFFPPYHRQASQMKYGSLSSLLQYPWSKIQSLIAYQYHILLLLYCGLIYQTYVMWVNTYILPWT